MNRQRRRAEAARARRSLQGYERRLLTAFHTCTGMADELRRRVVHAVVAHDPACAIYTERRICTCTPDISLVPFDDDVGVYVIDEQGNAHRSSRQ